MRHPIMTIGTYALQRFRSEVLKLFLFIALAISGPLIPFYYGIGIPELSMACGIYFALTAFVGQYWRDHTSQIDVPANIFVASTLTLIMTGIYMGSPDLNNDPWLLIFPLLAFSLAGPRAGIYWSLGAIALLAVVHAFKSEPGTWTSELILVMSFLATAILTFFFTRHNEANLVLIGEMTNTDPLTLTHNRRHFEEMLEAEFKRNTRSGDSMTVYMIDIDFFKQYNDRYGHIKGDEVLLQVASILKHTVRRASDQVFRYGGEEFAILSSGLTQEQAASLAERLRTSVFDLMIGHERSTLGRLSISVGYSHADRLPSLSPRTLLEEADEALYRAKASGRNQVAGYTLAIDAIAASNPGTATEQAST